MGNCPTISHTFFSLIFPVDEFSLKEMRTWGQSKISSYCFFVWCKSRELGARRSSRFPRVMLVVEIFSSDRVAFRTLSNINDGAHLQKHPTVLKNGLPKSSTADFRPDYKLGSDQRHYLCEVQVDCKCVEFVAVGQCSRKWLSIDQTTKNATSGDLEMPRVVIHLGVTGLKKTKFEYPPDLFEERGRNSSVIQCVRAPLDDRVVLVLWGVGPTLRSMCVIQG